MNTPLAYFEGQYARSRDPWQLADRWYDQRKYAITAAALPRARYERAFEPGCSVGELTCLLAERCARLLAADTVTSATSTARQRTAHLPHVTVEQLSVPRQWPEEPFDLIVLSEILYYFDEPSLQLLQERCVNSLTPGGHLVSVHWNHPVPEHLRTGREIADRLQGQSGLSPLARYDDPDFTLTVHEHGTGPAASPAEGEGLV